MTLSNVYEITAQGKDDFYLDTKKLKIGRFSDRDSVIGACLSHHYPVF